MKIFACYEIRDYNPEQLSDYFSWPCLPRDRFEEGGCARKAKPESRIDKGKLNMWGEEEWIIRYAAERHRYGR